MVLYDIIKTDDHLILILKNKPALEKGWKT